VCVCVCVCVCACVCVRVTVCVCVHDVHVFIGTHSIRTHSDVCGKNGIAPNLYTHATHMIHTRGTHAAHT